MQVGTCSRLLAFVVLLIACGPAAAPTSAPAPAKPTAAQSAPVPAATAAQAPAAAAPAGAADARGLRADAGQWERVKEAAKREGRLVVVGPTFPGLRESIVQAMQNEYGISVEYLGLPSGEALTRIDREAKAGRPTVDAHIGGSPTCWLLGERGQVDNVAPLLVDPALFEPGVWREGSPRLLKPAPQLARDFYCGVQGSDWVMTDLFVNRELIPPGTITSWRDLLKPEYRGKIAAHDPRRPGSGGATLAYLYSLFGEQYVRDLYVGQQLTYTVDYRQLAEWVARGTYPIGLSLVQANVEPLRAAGLPIERIFPEDGPGSSLGGFSVVMRVANGPNPNAGQLFLNWFLSRDAQLMWEREMLESSLRADVTHNVPDYVIPKAGVRYVDAYDPDWHHTHRVPAEAKIVELLGR